MLKSKTYICNVMFSTVRFSADNWNKLKNVCSKQIGEKMKVYKTYKDKECCLYTWAKFVCTQV